MFLVEIAQKKLFPLAIRRIPPRNAHHECIGTCASGEASRFVSREEPLFRIDGVLKKSFRPPPLVEEAGKGNARPANTFRSRIPLLQGQVLAVMIAVDARSEKRSETIHSLDWFQNEWIPIRNFLPACRRNAVILANLSSLFIIDKLLLKHGDWNHR